MYLLKITDEQYHEAAALAAGLIERLNPQVIGRSAPAILSRRGVAKRILIPDISRKYCVIRPFAVLMAAPDGTDYEHPFLTHFVERDELRRMWIEAFEPFVLRHFAKEYTAMLQARGLSIWGFGEPVGNVKAVR